jgi:HEAT repeat protein
VFRASLFRAGYELFYTPIPFDEKRAAKSVIDVGFDRLGDALGGGTIRFVLFLAPFSPSPIILALAIACSAVALIAASRLNRSYVDTLERSLLHRAVEIDLSEAEDLTTRTTMMRSLTALRKAQRPRPTAVVPGVRPDKNVLPLQPGQGGVVGSLDTEMLQILALRSRDQDRVRRVLHSDLPLSRQLVPHVIPLLAWDPVADDAVRALRRVAEERVGELVDALLDSSQDFAVRRRLARVFSVCSSQRAVDGLLLGLEDMRFEVRYQCARSLAAVLAKNPRARVDREFVFEVIEREVAVGRPVWESNRLLHGLDDREENMFVDEFVKDRAGRSLAHVFTLLSLVLPAEPLQIAFRGLHSSDRNLRGTALEYLESVLPQRIREHLWPFLEDPRPSARTLRQREEILADLIRSNESIMLNLEELKARAERKRGAP